VRFQILVFDCFLFQFNWIFGWGICYKVIYIKLILLGNENYRAGVLLRIQINVSEKL